MVTFELIQMASLLNVSRATEVTTPISIHVTLPPPTIYSITKGLSYLEE